MNGTQVARGSSVTVTVSVVSSTTSSALVDLEIYNGSTKSFQRFWDGQSFTPNVARQFTATWSVPANEATTAHVVKVGVFGAGWNGLAHWNNDAARVTVTVSGATTTTPQPSTTTTAKPTTTTAKPTTTTQRRPTTTQADHDDQADDYDDGEPTTTTQRRRTTTAKPTTTTQPPTTTTTAKPTTTTQPPTTTTTAKPTTTTTQAPRRPPRPPTGHFSTLPPGAALPSDAACAAQVRPMAERRPINNVPNHTKGAAVSGLARVTGNFTGTTDEIIEWAACKWGIDEDIVRAQIAKESWWHQDAAGDLTSDQNACYPTFRTGSGQCPESIGLGQVRYQYHTLAFTNGYAVVSSAFNLDYTYSVWRGCYEGQLTWLNTVERGATYAAGDVWGCLGVWFSGRWHTAPAETYIAAVKDYLNQRVWESRELPGRLISSGSAAGFAVRGPNCRRTPRVRRLRRVDLRRRGGHQWQCYDR